MASGGLLNYIKRLISAWHAKAVLICAVIIFVAILFALHINRHDFNGGYLYVQDIDYANECGGYLDIQEIDPIDTPDNYADGQDADLGNDGVCKAKLTCRFTSYSVPLAL